MFSRARSPLSASSAARQEAIAESCAGGPDRVPGRHFHVLLLSVMSLIGCSRDSGNVASANVSGQIADLERVQNQRRLELAEIQRQILEARAELALAERRSEYARCEAARSEYQSAASERRSTCLATRMQFAQCMATRAQGESNGTMGGMLLGLGLAVLTGGATAPLMVGGAAIGRGVGGSNAPACGGQPTCSTDDAVIREALRLDGHPPPAHCGQAPAGATEFSQCTVTPRGAFHLRPSARAESTGRSMPSRTPVAVLARGTIVRGATRLFQVRVRDGATGWIFLGRDELSEGGCPWSD